MVVIPDRHRFGAVWFVDCFDKRERVGTIHLYTLLIFRHQKTEISDQYILFYSVEGWNGR